MITVEQVRLAKTLFHMRHPKTPIGISNNPNGSGYMLVVRVETQMEADKIPSEFENVPVLCKVFSKFAT